MRRRSQTPTRPIHPNHPSLNADPVAINGSPMPLSEQLNPDLSANTRLSPLKGGVNFDSLNMPYCVIKVVIIDMSDLKEAFLLNRLGERIDFFEFLIFLDISGELTVYERFRSRHSPP